MLCYVQPADLKSALFDSLMEASIDGVFLYRPVCDENGQIQELIIQMVNRHACRFLGMEEADLVGKDLCTLFPGAREEALPDYQKTLDTGVPCLFERWLNFEGREAVIRYTGTRIEDRLMTVAADITDLRLTQEKLEQQATELLYLNNTLEEQSANMVGLVEDIYQLNKERERDKKFLDQLINVTPMPIFHRDAAGRFTLVNEAYASLLRLQRTDIEGRTPSEIYGSDVADDIDEKDRDLMTGDARHEAYERDMIPPGGGEKRQVVIHKSVFQPDDAAERSIVGAVVDVTEERELRAELHRLATTDPLTGIANRRSFMDALSQEIDRSVGEGSPLSVAILDIDRFKSVNDTHGHDVGDIILKAVAEIARDLAGNAGYMAARLGGEEFAVLMAGADLSASTLFAEMLRRRIEGCDTPIGDRTLAVTVSIGLTELRNRTDGKGAADLPGDLPGDLLKEADSALYQAKESGRNKVLVFAD